MDCSSSPPSIHPREFSDMYLRHTHAWKSPIQTHISLSRVAGWRGFDITERVPLDEIAHAHELVAQPDRRGRVVLTL
jgi:hypothetical protein